MQHWTPGHQRGALDHPAATPPVPQPTTANDVSTRVTRLEEHSRFAAWDRMRIETESHRRGVDNAQAIHGLSTRLSALEKGEEARRSAQKARGDLWEQAKPAGKIVAAILLILAVASGKMTVDQIKAVGPWFGLPG